MSGPTPNGRGPVTLVDTCVLIDMITRSPEWLERSFDAFAAAADAGDVAINPVIYAELAHGYADRRRMVAALPAGLLRLPLPYEAAWLAGRALAAHRRRGGSRASPLADFYVGGHAQASGLRLLTRDEARFRTYFPAVELVVP